MSQTLSAAVGIGLSLFLFVLYAYIIIGMIRWYKNYPKE